MNGAGVYTGVVTRVADPRPGTGQPARAWVTVDKLTGPDYVHGGTTGVQVADLPPVTVDHPTGGSTASGYPALAKGDRVLVGLLEGRAEQVVVLARLTRA